MPSLKKSIAYTEVDVVQEALGFAGHLELLPVTLSTFASLSVNSAKGLARRTKRSFAALRMTGLDLAVGEELSSAFEPCLNV
jgi:hypothetical protein